MKKTIGWILISIPILNIIGKVGAVADNKEVSISPAAFIILIMMFFGGISLIGSSSKKKDGDLPSKDLEKKDD